MDFAWFGLQKCGPNVAILSHDCVVYLLLINKDLITKKKWREIYKLETYLDVWYMYVIDHKYSIFHNISSFFVKEMAKWVIFPYCLSFTWKKATYSGNCIREHCKSKSISTKQYCRQKTVQAAFPLKSLSAACLSSVVLKCVLSDTVIHLSSLHCFCRMICISYFILLELLPNWWWFVRKIRYVLCCHMKGAAFNKG